MDKSISHWGLFNQDVDNAIGGHCDHRYLTTEYPKSHVICADCGEKSEIKMSYSVYNPRTLSFEPVENNDDGEGMTEEMWATARPASEVFAELGMDVGNPIVAKAYPLDDETNKAREAFKDDMLSYGIEEPTLSRAMATFDLGYQDATAAAEAKYLPVIEKMATTLNALKAQNLGDYCYDVRSRAVESGDGFQGDSWQHPKVLEFSKAIDGIDEALALAAPLLKGE